MFIFLLSLAHSKSLIFLQDTITSIGTFADGVESVASDLESFSSDLEDTLEILDSEIDGSISVSAEIGVTLIDSEVDRLQISLDDVNSDIDELEAELSFSYDVCSLLSSCNSCVVNSNCAWCSSSATCVPGDDSGPFAIDCPSWEYEECIFSVCEYYTSCTACLSTSDCGWCENGENCLSDIGDCSGTFYYEGDETCPHSEAEVIESVSDNGESEELWNRINILKEESYRLVGLIDSLNEDKEEMLEDANDGMEIEISAVEVNSDLDDLADAVDELKLEEDENSREFQEELAEDTQEEVISEVSEESDESSVVMIEVIENAYEDVETDLNELEDNLSESLDAIGISLSAISDAVIEDSLEDTLELS